MLLFGCQPTRCLECLDAAAPADADDDDDDTAPGDDYDSILFSTMHPGNMSCNKMHREQLRKLWLRGGL